MHKFCQWISNIQGDKKWYNFTPTLSFSCVLECHIYVLVCLQVCNTVYIFGFGPGFHKFVKFPAVRIGLLSKALCMPPPPNKCPTYRVFKNGFTLSQQWCFLACLNVIFMFLCAYKYVIQYTVLVCTFNINLVATQSAQNNIFQTRQWENSSATGAEI